MKTTYRNTDLDLIAAEPLERLSQKLVEAGMIELGSFQDNETRWNASFEVLGDEDDRWHENAEATILAMLDVLDNLPEKEKELFGKCGSREFNVAYDVGEAPRDFNEVVAWETLARMVALKITMRITLYSANRDIQGVPEN